MNARDRLVPARALVVLAAAACAPACHRLAPVGAEPRDAAPDAPALDADARDVEADSRDTAEPLDAPDAPVAPAGVQIIVTSAPARFCSGTLMNNRWVLTASQCITNADGSYVPDDSITVIYPGATAPIVVLRKAVFPRDPSDAATNVAVIELTAPVTIRDSDTGYRSHFYTGGTSVLAGQSVFCSGFGTTIAGTGPDARHHASLPVVSARSDPAAFTIGWNNETGQGLADGELGASCSIGAGLIVGNSAGACSNHGSPGQTCPMAAAEVYRGWALNRLGGQIIGSEGLSSWETTVTGVTDPAVTSQSRGGGTNAEVRSDLFILGPDQFIHHYGYDGLVWSAGASITTSQTFSSAPAAVSWGWRRLDVFGNGGDGVLRHVYSDDNTMFQPSPVEIADTPDPALQLHMAGNPVATGWVNRLDVFARLTNGHLGHWYLLDGFDSEDLGTPPSNDTIQGDPAAVADPVTHRIDVVVRGADNRLYARTSIEAGSFEPWVPLGGPTVVSDPAVATMAPGRIDVVAVTSDAGRPLFHWWPWSGGVFFYESIDSGPVIDTPAIVSWGPNRLDVFARHADGSTWHNWLDGTVFDTAEPWGNERAVGSPRVTSWGPGHLGVYVRVRNAAGPDSILVRQFF